MPRILFLLLICSLALCTPCTPAALAAPGSSPDLASIDWNPKIQGDSIVSLAQDRQGDVWVGTEDQGVWRFSPEAGKGWTQFTTREGLGDNNGYAITCDGLGRTWVGHLNHGVSVFNGREWRNYGVLDGPLGARIFALATSPVDGDVWMATSLGLARYSLKENTWSYLTQADGLPSNQINALAFDKTGNLFVGSQCDGIAMARSADNYVYWRTIPGPERMPNTPGGDGLPSPLINCLLVARNGTIWAGTSCGLARSQNGGKNWRFLRGEDWLDKVKGLYHGPPPVPVDTAGHRLLADYVTSLAEDPAGNLWIGYRQKGYEVVDGVAGQRLYPLAKDNLSMDFVTALLPTTGGSILVGKCSGGLDLAPLAFVLTGQKAGPSLPAVPPPLPSPAKPPIGIELQALEAKLAALPGPGVSGAFLGDDWETAGDWVGRYGRQLANLCGMPGPGDQDPRNSGLYSIGAATGPHRDKAGGVYTYISDLRTENPRTLYNPVLGYRRQAEWNDGSFQYPLNFEGPDLWIHFKVPAGVHRLSLYFLNKDGHTGQNRYRDYVLELKTEKPNPEQAETATAVARARVYNFWGGVYKQFLVKGPGQYSIKIGKNNSHVAFLCGIFVDRVQGEPAPNEVTFPVSGKSGVSYQPPDPDLTSPSGASQTSPIPAVDPGLLAAAGSLWSRLDAAYVHLESAPLQWPYRLMAYRAASAAGAPPALLANWRWRLPTWTDSDRQQFREAMARSFQPAKQAPPEPQP